MGSITTPAQALLGTDAVAHAWTSNPDVSPQASVAWVVAQDDEILFGTDINDQSARKVSRHAQVGSVCNPDKPSRDERGCCHVGTAHT